MKYAVTLFTLSVAFALFSGCATRQQPGNYSKNNGLSLPHENIKLAENTSLFGYVCEPSIAISPENPANMVAGNVMNGVHYSTDGGHTWVSGELHSPLGVFGDPCIIADAGGAFYYLHLADPDDDRNSKNFLNQIVLQKSTDGGKSWTSGTGIGYSHSTQQDKHWAAISPADGSLCVTWTEFDKYGSKNPDDKSRILFSRSADGGDTFSVPVVVSDLEGDCLDDDYTTEGAVPAIDTRGNIYVSWAFDGKIYFDKSTDNGKTWGTDRVIARQAGGWAQDIPGIYRCNGMPVTCVDNSPGKYRGRIYVNWTDQRNGSDNTDVFLIYSADGGENWSLPKKVNTDDTSTHQFFSWMDVDPVTGYIYILYYDRSRYKDTRTDVCLAVSKDGGDTFRTQIISRSPFVPMKEVFFGDYTNIDAFDGNVRPIWTRLDNYKLSVWTALITDRDTKSGGG